MKRITFNGRLFIVGGCRQILRPSGRFAFADMKRRGAIPQIALPTVTNYRAAAQAGLAQVDRNDKLGDCVIAAGEHIRNVTSANSGTMVQFSDAQAIAQYSAIGGYDPNAPLMPDGTNPTDNGCDPINAINYWQSTGWPDGVMLENAVAVNGANPQEIREAIFWFENLFFAVPLPDQYVNPFPAGDGFVWDVAGDPDWANGHAFAGDDYGLDGVHIATWGMQGVMTWAAVAKYTASGSGGQLFTFLPADVVSKVTGKSPAGYDNAQLAQYLQDMREVQGRLIPF